MFFSVYWRNLQIRPRIHMSAQITQTMAFIQIMVFWTPGRSPKDHLNILYPFYFHSVIFEY